MNYRHIYHAGNFADVFKHLILLMTLDYLQQKEKGLFLLDAFAGTGLYDLNSEKARRTDESSAGIKAIMEADFSNPDLKLFQEAVRRDWQKGLYPGSPLLMARRLRAQDRLSANELHGEDSRELRKTLADYANVQVTCMDAYQSIRASLPPVERRGLILIDPPFERKDEFEALAVQLREWIKRFATGTYIVWYPIKHDSREDLLEDAIFQLGIGRSWKSEFLIRDRHTLQGLNGCGMLILNVPYQLPERIGSLKEELELVLKGKVESRYLLA